MVSVATLRTFEMDLSVSLTRWNSRLKPKENVDLNLTIGYDSSWVIQIIRWIRIEDHYLREYASE